MRAVTDMAWAWQGSSRLGRLGCWPMAINSGHQWLFSGLAAHLRLVLSPRPCPRQPWIPSLRGLCSGQCHPKVAVPRKWQTLAHPSRPGKCPPSRCPVGSGPHPPGLHPSPPTYPTSHPRWVPQEHTWLPALQRGRPGSRWEVHSSTTTLVGPVSRGSASGCRKCLGSIGSALTPVFPPGRPLIRVISSFHPDYRPLLSGLGGAASSGPAG